MAVNAWFCKMEQPDAGTIAAGEHCLSGLLATKIVGYENEGQADEAPVLRTHVPWPALHQSIAESLRRARAQLKA